MANAGIELPTPEQVGKVLFGNEYRFRIITDCLRFMAQDGEKEFTLPEISEALHIPAGSSRPHLEGLVSTGLLTRQLTPQRKASSAMIHWYTTTRSELWRPFNAALSSLDPTFPRLATDGHPIDPGIARHMGKTLFGNTPRPQIAMYLVGTKEDKTFFASGLSREIHYRYGASTVTNVFEDLEATGLVTRVVDPGHDKRHTFQLTDSPLLDIFRELHEVTPPEHRLPEAA